MPLGSTPRWICGSSGVGALSSTTGTGGAGFGSTAEPGAGTGGVALPCGLLHAARARTTRHDRIARLYRSSADRADHGVGELLRVRLTAEVTGPALGAGERRGDSRAQAGCGRA